MFPRLLLCVIALSGQCYALSKTPISSEANRQRQTLDREEQIQGFLIEAGRPAHREPEAGAAPLIRTAHKTNVFGEKGYMGSNKDGHRKHRQELFEPESLAVDSSRSLHKHPASDDELSGPYEDSSPDSVISAAVQHDEPQPDQDRSEGDAVDLGKVQLSEDTAAEKAVPVYGASQKSDDMVAHVGVNSVNLKTGSSKSMVQAATSQEQNSSTKAELDALRSTIAELASAVGGLKALTVKQDAAPSTTKPELMRSHVISDSGASGRGPTHPKPAESWTAKAMREAAEESAAGIPSFADADAHNIPLLPGPPIPGAVPFNDGSLVAEGEGSGEEFRISGDPNQSPLASPFYVQVMKEAGNHVMCSGNLIWKSKPGAADLESCEQTCNDNGGCRFITFFTNDACATYGEWDCPATLDATIPELPDVNSTIYEKKTPATSGYTLMAQGVPQCPSAQLITTPEECKLAYKAIKGRYDLDAGNMTMQIGDFADGEPVGCSVRVNKTLASNEFDPNAGDQPAYWNSADTSLNTLVDSGDFRVVCAQVSRYSGETAEAGVAGPPGVKGPIGPNGTVEGPHGREGPRGVPGPVGMPGPPGGIGGMGHKGKTQKSLIPASTAKTWQLAALVIIQGLVSFGALFTIKSKYGKSVNKSGDTIAFM